MNDILDKIQQICRLCLLEQSLMFSLHSKSYSNDINIFQMLMSCTVIKVDLNDNLPQLVCSSCLGRLETAYLFKQECERSDQALRKLLLENADRLDTKLDITTLNNLINDARNFIISDNDVINASSMVKVEINDEDVDNERDLFKRTGKEEMVYKEETSESENSETETTKFYSEFNSDSETNSDSDALLVEIKKKLTNNKKKRKNQITKKTINNNKEKVPKPIKKLKIKRLKQKHEQYECLICKKAFRHHQRFWHHRESCLFFSCYICFKQFSDKDIMNKHIEDDHSDQNYICNQQDCDIELKNYYLFLLHKKNDHGVTNYLQCFECEKAFDCHEQWDMHIQKHLANPFKCEQCEERFSTKKKFQAHVKVHPDYYKCNECLRTFTSNKNLVRHKKTHQTSYICEECGKRFQQNYLLNKHIDYAHKGLPRAKEPPRPKTQLCPYCGQCFSRPRDLTVHIRTHTGQKPFSCEQCNYRSHDKNLLKSHLNSHTGKKPYHCEICGKTFATKSYLTVHIRFHTGDRPYKCSHSPCDKGFTNSKDLKVHERTHTGIKLYHCDICNNSFTTLHYFKVHSKKHLDRNQ